MDLKGFTSWTMKSSLSPLIMWLAIELVQVQFDLHQEEKKW